jgi:pyrroline-5-carboxylate reductase
MLHSARIVVVGAGHMGGALVEGFLARGLDKTRLHVIDPAAKEKAKAWDVDWSADANGLAHAPHVVIFAVKPQLMPSIAPAYARLAAPGCFFLSVAAGLAIDNFRTWLGAEARVVRAMPNTPAAIGQGITALVATDNLAIEQMALAEALMACVGDTVWLSDENLMDAVTAVSGSGPAYFFLLMEALEAAGVAQGLSSDVARKLAVHTAAGAGALAKQRLFDQSPADLRVAVTSPNGTTAAALHSFAADGFETAVNRAVQAAVARGKQLRETAT